jgi:hypothetical protein
MNGNCRFQGGFRGAGIGSRNPASGGSSGYCITIACGTFNATDEMHGTAIGAGGNGITDRLSKVDKIHLKNATIAASS